MKNVDVEETKKKIIANIKDNDEWLDSARFKDEYDEDEWLDRTRYNKLFKTILYKLEGWETNLIIFETFNNIKKQEDRAKLFGMKTSSYRVTLAKIRYKIKELCLN